MAEQTKEVRLAYPLDLVQALDTYLLTRPCGEAMHLLQGLRGTGVRTEHDLAAAQADAQGNRMLLTIDDDGQVVFKGQTVKRGDPKAAELLMQITELLC